jgi:hypothetical protein
VFDSVPHASVHVLALTAHVLRQHPHVSEHDELTARRVEEVRQHAAEDEISAGNA